jgi:hypothetical protein
LGVDAPAPAGLLEPVVGAAGALAATEDVVAGGAADVDDEPPDEVAVGAVEIEVAVGVGLPAKGAPFGALTALVVGVVVVVAGAAGEEAAALLPDAGWLLPVPGGRPSAATATLPDAGVAAAAIPAAGGAPSFTSIPR